MSKSLKIKLTPLEPYFFGSDRTFHYGEEDKIRIGRSDYFIKSEVLPMQTSLFGILRFLGIENKNGNYRLSEEDKKNIGEESFSYEKQDQSFGKIEGISPLYLEVDKPGGKESELLIRLPRDHRSGGKYTPFEKYEKTVTSLGDRYLPTDYDPKEGITDGFMMPDGEDVVEASELFSMIKKTGIRKQRKADQKGNNKDFYKMGFINKNNDGFSFVFFAKVKDDFPEITDKTVFMGARKSSFAVTVQEGGEPQINMKGVDLPGIKKLYFISDTYLPEDKMKAVRSKCVSMNLDKKTARGYTTNYDSGTQRGRFTKTDCLYNLISAGSVLLLREEEEEAIKALIKNDHMEMIGCNHIVIGGEQ